MCVVVFGVCSGVFTKHSWCVVGVEVVAAVWLWIGGGFVCLSCYALSLSLWNSYTLVRLVFSDYYTR